MSEANRQRRLQNREARTVAVEEQLRKAKRQRIVLVSVGLLLAVAVGVALVARATTGDDGSANADTTTTTSATAASVAGKPCVKVSENLPEGAPAVPVQVGPPPTKLVKVDLRTGTGPVVAPDSTVTIDYVGVACSTGRIFDSSYQRNESVTTSLDEVIPGWKQGLPGMRVGGTRLLGVPAALAYRSEGNGALIAPDESLWFVVKLDKIDAAATTTIP